ncbi:MAG TPA: hypothetical protein VMT52_17870 [Planctomycetota bacterium]|nr:hypothetical protein [Planctomycetota bacterium]
MRRELLAGAAALLWTASGLAQTADPGKDGSNDAIRALQRLESARESELPAHVRSHLIDKRRIADQALHRAIGLREAGNPHIQVGEGLLLPTIQEDPSRSRVDIDKLREERIAMIERGGAETFEAQQSAIAVATTEESGSVSAAPEPPAPQPAGPVKPVDAFVIVFVLSSILLLGGGAIFYFREKRKG